MFALILKATRVLLVLTILTGGIYPAVVTVVAGALFPGAAAGSLIERDGKIVGSALLAQKFPSPRYFHPRPSAADFATMPSGASNLGPTSKDLKAAAESRVKELGAGAPAELVLASASGLDPDVSPDAARFQVARVMTARGLGAEKRAEFDAMLEAHVETPTFGFLGRPRVNVLLLNLDLDRRFP